MPGAISGSKVEIHNITPRNPALNGLTHVSWPSITLTMPYYIKLAVGRSRDLPST